MVSIIIKEWTTKIELVPTVQKRNAAVLLRKPGRLAPQYAHCKECSLRSSAVAVPFLNGRFPTQNGRSFFNQVT